MTDKQTTAKELEEAFGRVDWEKVINDGIIKKNEGEYLMSPSYGISITNSLSYGDKYIVVHNDAYQKLTEATDTSFFGKIKYGWRLFALSVSDWKDAMMREDYTEEFFWFLGRGVDT